MLRFIDKQLDKITMYRLVLYYLIILVTAAAGLSVFGILHYNPVAVVASALFLTIVCWTVNWVFACVFEAPANVESSYITALILALIITPLSDPHNALFLAAAGGLAIASKYILAINKKHIFNPAAIAVVLLAFGAQQSASWWVGTTSMLPFVVIGGVLIIRKIQRGKMLISYFVAVLVSSVVVNIITHSSIAGSLQKTILHSSLFFLAFIMLTEPLTSPRTANKQVWYGALAGALFPPQIHLFSLYSTPELTLIIANIYSYIVSPKLKLVPQLSEKKAIGSDVVDFVFSLQKPITFKPGQYMEWTLGHNHPDSRGNRRYFTLASSPTEHNIRLGVKFYPNSSSYKKAMLTMKKYSKITASQVAGDFTLPDDENTKLMLIAGGIGITPFRSMIKYLTDKNESRNIVLMYSENKVESIAYKEVFDEARSRLDLKTVYTLTKADSIPIGWQGRRGAITADMIKMEAPDYLERSYYISGPHSMVTAVQDVLHSLGIASSRIKVDFFPGYA